MGTGSSTIALGESSKPRAAPAREFGTKRSTRKRYPDRGCNFVTGIEMGDLAGQRVLLTGGSGFLGRHVRDRIALRNPAALVAPR